MRALVDVLCRVFSATGRVSFGSESPGVLQMSEYVRFGADLCGRLSDREHVALFLLT